MNELLCEISSTVISGIVLTLILFIINEYLLPQKNITGEWKSTLKIENSAYNPYKGLTIEYKIHLLQKGKEIIGSGEKIKDILLNGDEVEYIGDKRVKISLNGYYERNYLRKSKVYLNISEYGLKRESSATYFLTVKSSKRLIGNFTGTAADSSGIIIFKKI
ncbi:MAG: hypothetical protein ACOH1N_08545 [Lutibacter sp.]